MIRYNRRFRVM